MKNMSESIANIVETCW